MGEERCIRNRVMSALAKTLTEEPKNRVSAAVIISDGQIHDLELVPNLDVPLHLLVTGEPEDWVRRLVAKHALGSLLIHI